MTLEESIRSAVREEVRAAVREALAEIQPKAGQSDRLTIAEAAAYSRKGVSTIGDWLRIGKLNRYGSGRGVLIDRGELDRLLAPKSTPKKTDAEIAARAERLARGGR